MQLLFTVPKVDCLDGGCGAGDRASDSIVAGGQGKHFLGPSDIEKVDSQVCRYNICHHLQPLET